MTEEQVKRIEKAIANTIIALGYIAENQFRAMQQESPAYGENSFLILAQEILND